jgi:hypothetical protein
MRTASVAPLTLAATLALASFTAANSGAPACPDETEAQRLNELLFCVPQSNQRYSFAPKGIGPIYWLGEEPIAPPANSESLKDADVTIARVWADHALVGTSDQASGRKGFDRFLDMIATSVRKAATAAGKAEAFDADVPIDESGRLQPFRFRRLESGILQGARQEPDGSQSYIILLRPPAGEEQPHLMLCGIAGAARDPSHLCMSFIALEGRRLAITIAGRNLERSFRVSEQIAKDLASFVKAPAATQ